MQWYTGNLFKKYKGKFCSVFTHILPSTREYGSKNPVFTVVLCTETNQLCSPLKISQPINAEWNTYDINNKGIYGCFYESKKFLGCLM